MVLHGHGGTGMRVLQEEVCGVGAGHLRTAKNGTQAAFSSCSHVQVRRDMQTWSSHSLNERKLLLAQCHGF